MLLPHRLQISGLFCQAISSDADEDVLSFLCYEGLTPGLNNLEMVIDLISSGERKLMRKININFNDFDKIYGDLAHLKNLYGDNNELKKVDVIYWAVTYQALKRLKFIINFGFKPNQEGFVPQEIKLASMRARLGTVLDGAFLKPCTIFSYAKSKLNGLTSTGSLDRLCKQNV